MAIESILLPGQRTGRATWWIGMLLLAGGGWLAGFLLYALLGDRLFNTLTGRLVLLGVSLLLVWLASILSAMRLRDRDLDPLPRVLPVAAVNVLKALLDCAGVTGGALHEGPLDTVFMAVFAGIGLWYIVALGFMAGTDGPNSYGEDAATMAAMRDYGRGPDGGG